MTGQAAANVSRLRELAAQGCTAEDIGPMLGICFRYVLALGRQHGINILRKPSGAALRRAEFKKLAASGLDAHVIADRLGAKLPAVYAMSRKLKIKLRRKSYAGAQRQPAVRDMQMAALYRSGKTLEQIGAEFGITRERVRQLLKKYHALNGAMGGKHVIAARKVAALAEKRNTRALLQFGCSYQDYIRIRDMNKPTRAFAAQRKNAQHRGIEWKLNLWQWWCIWEQSGHWRDRGRGQGYCMCRKGDVGPYAVDNVFIAPSRLNSSEQARKKSSLPIGVRKNSKGEGFLAHRQIGGKKLYLGVHPTPELAHAAYLAAASTLQVAA